jgi:ATP-dependent DNA helicase DinG
VTRPHHLVTIESMKSLFAEKAVLTMRDEITAADGNEIFFLGRTDENGTVTAVDPLARGSRDAVAAIMIAVSFGDVVIHNHPSGTLTPSQADLEIAAVLGNQGVGFYIIDNGATRCYQAVSPFLRKTVEHLSFPEIEQFFAPEGVLSRNLDGYEHREEQTRMAFAVAEAFNRERVAVIEAGTGTGKSLAYLLPAVLWSLRNRERVVVSTNTINLQEQLIKKDIPFLQKKGGLSFRAVLVKGRSNYLCLRKLRTIETDPSLFKEDEIAGELDALVSWSRTTGEGCRNDLSFIPRDEVWEEVCCEADQCGRVKCSHYGQCFFYTARREAAGAELLVVNHALLLADVAVRAETGYDSSAILPPFTRLIFDEGHHLEDTATNFFSSRTSRQSLLRILGRLQHPRKAQRGILPQLSARLSREIPEELDVLYMEVAALLEERLLPGRASLTDVVTQVLDGMAFDLIAYLNKDKKSSGERKLRLTPALYAEPFWLAAETAVRRLVKELTEYISHIQAFFRSCDQLPEAILAKLAGNLIDLRGIRGRLEGVVKDLGLFVSRDDRLCHWFEASSGSRGTAVRLCSSPIQVAESIKTVVLDKFRTVVLTSATLAVGERFDYLKKMTGIDLLDQQRVTELLLSSPFNYERQTFIGIPDDVPEPSEKSFASVLQTYLLHSVTASGGRAFVLFTSYDLLSRAYAALREPMIRAGLTPMRQGEINRHMLLNRFRHEQNAVLFGTDSFWEGVDVQGRALELVIITRLPFRVPTEPILAARAEQIAAMGGDPFMEYTVPQAVIKFKQGFGRLIRSRDDRGAVLICDSRVLSRNYGRFFLDSLPKIHITRGEGETVLREMKRFFQRLTAAEPQT